MAKKKKSIYSRRLKDINKDGKRNFGDTFLGDLLGADGKVGIGKGRPGLVESLKGARREKPITKKPKKKPPVGKKPKARPKKKAEPNVRVGITTSTTVVDKSLPSNRPSKDKKLTDKTKKDPKDITSGTPSFRDRTKDVKKIDVPFAERVKGEDVSNKAVPKDKKDNKDQQSSRNQQIYVSPYVKAISDFFKVDSVVKGNPKGRNKARTGNYKGGMIDYRKTGMFYGGMTKRGKK